jgi:nitrilase
MRAIGVPLLTWAHLDSATIRRPTCGIAAGAQLVVFPEAFVPGYPFRVRFILAGHTQALREVYAEPEQLGAAAKEAGVVVAIGINEVNSEASATFIYIYIGADGAIIGKHYY